ncbi:MAG: ATP-binding protein [Pseudomonadota bacterium]
MTQDFFHWQSLQGKITLGYYGVAAIILVISLFFAAELRGLEKRVELGLQASDLFDTALEIRRFERNYFLYHLADDRAENGRYIDQARDLLRAHRADFLAIAPAGRLDELDRLLDGYQHEMAAYAGAEASPRRAAEIEPLVRALGQDVVAIAQDMAVAERRSIQTTLAAYQGRMLAVIAGVAVLIVALGRALSQRVVRPLKALETSVAAISANRRETLAAPSQEREIVSIIVAFNHMLKELDMRQKSLMRSERLASLGTMLSGVAHELNNPLSNISTSCQILQEEAGECDAAANRVYLEQIDQQTERARDIVRSLLDFSRERPFRRSPVPLRQLVTQTVGFVRGEVSARSVVSLDIPEDLAVPADAQRLQQVFVNLLRNALDELPPGGGIRVAARTIRADGPPEGMAMGPGCDSDAPMVEISVADDGPGIAPEILPRVFDPFFTTKEVGHGMGLGLFIVYEIVDEHDGCIAVRSEPGQGATFLIRLPLAAGDLAARDGGE